MRKKGKKKGPHRGIRTIPGILLSEIVLRGDPLTNKKEQMPPRRLSILTRGFEFRGQPIKIVILKHKVERTEGAPA